VPPAKPGPTPADALKVQLDVNDLAYDPARGLLYAAVASKANRHGNTIAAIDPVGGTIEWTINVGSDPAVLAMSDSSKTLWVGLRGAGAIQRVDLEKRTAGPLIMLNKARWGTLFAETMVVVPGKSDTVVVSLYAKGVSPRHNGCAVFDNDTPRPMLSTGSCNRLARTDDPKIVFGSNEETTEFGLRRLKIYKNGIGEERCFHGVIDKFNTEILFAGGRIYATTGAVIDAQNGQLIGTIPVPGRIAVDTAAKRAYVVAAWEQTITAIDTETLTKRGSCKAPIPGGFGKERLILMGGTALAYRIEHVVVIVPVKMIQ
jgi:DNA-binding beta-propeller fold protein YncE